MPLSQPAQHQDEAGACELDFKVLPVLGGHAGAIGVAPLGSLYVRSGKALRLALEMSPPITGDLKWRRKGNSTSISLRTNVLCKLRVHYDWERWH